MAETLLEAAKSFVPIIRANLDKIDSECRLPSELADAMAQKGLFGLYVPKCLGGPEADPITAFPVVEEISRADGSTGWCCFNGTALTSAVSRISVEAARFATVVTQRIAGDADPRILVGMVRARSRHQPEITHTLEGRST